MTNHTIRRTLSLLLTIALIMGLFTGCGRNRVESASRREKTAARRTESREQETEPKREEKREEKQEEKKETQPQKKENELPSFLEFARGSDFEVSQFDTHDGYFSISYKSEDASDLAYAEDYIARMLGEENCVIVVEDGKDRDDWYLKKLLLDHPYGASKHRMDALDDFWDNVGDLFLKINYYKDDGEVYFNIVYSEDLEIADSKDAPNGGGGGGTDLFGKACSWCGGDGRCNECGGDGRVYNWLPGTRTYVDQNCTNCNMGRCRQCGGDGKN